jgi:hypothetical protein
MCSGNWDGLVFPHTTSDGTVPPKDTELSDTNVVQPVPGMPLVVTSDRHGGHGHGHGSHRDSKDWEQFIAREQSDTIRDAHKLNADLIRDVKQNQVELRELKFEMSLEAAKTRELMQAQEIQRLRDKSEAKDRALAAYFARNVPPVIPVCE